MSQHAATVDPGSLSIEFFDYSLATVPLVFVDVFTSVVDGTGTELDPFDIFLDFYVDPFSPFLDFEGAGFTISFDVGHSSVTPEPSILLVLWLGLGLLGIRRKT
jgi:hypothetical protein